MTGSLEGLRVLAVEDEGIVAMMLEDILAELGCQVVGPAARLAEALALLDAGGIDAAVLDVNLAGETVFPVADRLARAGVPFIFATGYGAAGLRGPFAGRRVLQKPYHRDGVREALEAAVLG